MIGTVEDIGDEYETEHDKRKRKVGFSTQSKIWIGEGVGRGKRVGQDNSVGRGIYQLAVLTPACFVCEGVVVKAVDM